MLIFTQKMLYRQGMGQFVLSKVCHGSRIEQFPDAASAGSTWHPVYRIARDTVTDWTCRALDVDEQASNLSGVSERGLSTVENQRARRAKSLRKR
jgi:hypothetical protein